MKKNILISLILLAVILLSACAGIADSQVDISAVQNKLDDIDAYKASLPEVQSTAQDSQDEPFRGFTFGTSMEMVGALETLPLSEQYSDALVYSESALYSYNMLLTYWFNTNDQLSSISYNMQNDAFFDTLNTLMTGLRGDYGEPYQFGYYDKENTVVSFASQAKALDAVDNDGAYYYEAFTDANEIQIELYAQKKDAGYEFWMYYTDYLYYNE